MASKNKHIVHDGEALDNLLKGAETPGEKAAMIIGVLVILGIFTVVLLALGGNF